LYFPSFIEDSADIRDAKVQILFEKCKKGSNNLAIYKIITNLAAYK